MSVRPLVVTDIHTETDDVKTITCHVRDVECNKSLDFHLGQSQKCLRNSNCFQTLYIAFYFHFDVSEGNIEATLIQDLLTGYDVDALPVRNPAEILQVKIFVLPLSIEYLVSYI